MKNNIMNESSLKKRAIVRVQKYVKKHKKMRFAGIITIFVIIVSDAICFGLYNNRKRILAIASVIFFFVSSSSFSYPELSLDVSFVSDDSATQKLSSETDSIILDAENDIYFESLEESKSYSSPIDGDLSEEIDIENIESEEEIKLDGNGELKGKVLESDQISIDDISNADINADVEEIESIDTENTDDYEFDPDDWKLILVNKQHPVPDGYEFPTAEIAGCGKLCDARILDSLLKMFSDAAADGVNLIVCSPYRSNNRQEMLFARKVNYYIEQGYDYMNAYSLASQAVTIPGYSEHELGLALDIICGDYTELDEGFGDTDAGIWLANNSYKYGFVVRYLKGKEDVTGIEYEPWHFRYVGEKAAQVMYDEGICLEEFWEEYLY